MFSFVEATFFTLIAVGIGFCVALAHVASECEEKSTFVFVNGAQYACFPLDEEQGGQDG